MSSFMRFLVTGGAGFIGSAVIRHLICCTDSEVLNIDKLTYAANLDSLKDVAVSDRYYFEQIDICNRTAVQQVLREFKPNVLMHLAAESHVDTSIKRPSEFIQTNIIGTLTLLEVARDYWLNGTREKNEFFRFHHISTDEVFGDLGFASKPFTETSPYEPSSPYSASKAGADHLVRAWYRTYELPVIVTNSTNNYGPYQFPEKLIPKVILRAINGQPLPIFGDGSNVRDWLFVEDHARILVEISKHARIGKTYNVGGDSEMTNIDVVRMVCHLLEELKPIKPPNIDRYSDLITLVKDRPGHDRRYAINTSKLENDLGLKAKENFNTGLRKTVEWYLINESWWKKFLIVMVILSDFGGLIEGNCSCGW